jgi:hypothetical protein
MTTSLKIHDQNVIVSGGPIKIGRLEQEWYEDVVNPEEFIAPLKSGPAKADIFTFWQRLPDVTPRFAHYMEPENIAALPITTYDNWFNTQIKSRTRGVIRKSAKQGVVVREVEYTDDFVRGMTSIFNETPMRQGRPFWHYGKDFDTVKRQFSKYLFREILIGAYFNDELIGFMMIGMAGQYALIGQIISKISHRDKGTNNSLMAKAVEICAARNIPYLVYLSWAAGSLTEFKRRNGFEMISLPRYYVPLTSKGRIALRLGLHVGVLHLIPDSALSRLKRLRTAGYRVAYSLRYRNALVADGEV